MDTSPIGLVFTSNRNDTGPRKEETMARFTAPIAFGTAYAGETNLVCPHCSSEYLHIQDSNVSYDKTPDSVGSFIPITCESCSEELFLTIVEHKGIIILQWYQPDIEDGVHRIKAMNKLR
jgi:hypothetical protein